MKIGSLFSGTGGLDLAVESVTGASPAWFVEYDEAPSKILAHHWPDVPNYGDVTKANWSDMPPVDIITGGFPCQPFSVAGQRKGTNDERHLWPYVRESIRRIRPRYAFLENVPGLRSMGFDQVLADLAALGFDAWWTTLRASDIGAPHHRERIFILAAPADSHGLGLEAGGLPSRPGAEVAQSHGGISSLSAHRRGIEWGEYAPVIRRWERVTRPAPFPLVSVAGRWLLAPEFASWMMGLPAGWITDVPGLSRADMLKVVGNGVVPQQAAAALAQLIAMMGDQEREVAA